MKLEEEIEYYTQIYQTQKVLREELNINLPPEIKENNNPAPTEIKAYVSYSKLIKIDITADTLLEDLPSFINSYKNAYKKALAELRNNLEEYVNFSKDIAKALTVKVILYIKDYNPFLDVSSKINELEYIKRIIEENGTYFAELDDLLKKKEQMLNSFDKIVQSKPFNTLFLKEFAKNSADYNSNNLITNLLKEIEKIQKKGDKWEQYLEFPPIAWFYNRS